MHLHWSEQYMDGGIAQVIINDDASSEYAILRG